MISVPNTNDDNDVFTIKIDNFFDNNQSINFHCQNIKRRTYTNHLKCYNHENATVFNYNNNK